jgi:hypothetical protein
MLHLLDAELEKGFELPSDIEQFLHNTNDQ